ncbi:MAG: hypothetical protein ACFFD1_13665, partial [Candidatus Thorarchaeota archaeon]
MSNYQIWFDRSFKSLANDKVYEAIREFNGAIFRILSDKDINKYMEIILKNMTQIFEMLFEKQLIHEIHQIMNFYFSKLNKMKLDVEYRDLLLEIPNRVKNAYIIPILFNYFLDFSSNFS